MTDPARGSDPDPSSNGRNQSSPKVAVISLHTSPLDQPGTGDSGGMNVYIAEVAERLAEQGIAADIYTRRHDPVAPHVETIGSTTKLIRVEAGPAEPVAKEELPSHL